MSEKKTHWSIRFGGWIISTVAAALVCAALYPMLTSVENVSRTTVASACNNYKSTADELFAKAKVPPGDPALFADSFENYSKAYGCGDMDSGIMLATMFCDGVGGTKDPRHARELLLQIEEKMPMRTRRLNDAWTYCDF